MTSFGPKLRRVRYESTNNMGCVDEVLIHYRSVPGQQTPVLCGWDAGRVGDHTDLEVTCFECLLIVKWFDSARKVRTYPKLEDGYRRVCIRCESDDFGEGPSDQLDLRTGVCGMCSRKEAALAKLENRS
jgi:hypothetical protein